MEILTKNESIKYTGGAIKLSAGIVVIISGVAAFILGVVDGMSNPKACNR